MSGVTESLDALAIDEEESKLTPLELVKADVEAFKVLTAEERTIEVCEYVVGRRPRWINLIENPSDKMIVSVLVNSLSTFHYVCRELPRQRLTPNVIIEVLKLKQKQGPKHLMSFHYRKCVKEFAKMIDLPYLIQVIKLTDASTALMLAYYNWRLFRELSEEQVEQAIQAEPDDAIHQLKKLNALRKHHIELALRVRDPFKHNMVWALSGTGFDLRVILNESKNPQEFVSFWMLTSDVTEADIRKFIALKPRPDLAVNIKSPLWDAYARKAFEKHALGKRKKEQERQLRKSARA